MCSSDLEAATSEAARTAEVIGIHGDNLETRQVSAHVEQFGDYLASQGM